MARQADPRVDADATKRPVLWIIGLIGVIAFPMIAALTYFQISQDPSLRPLGVTQEAERAYVRGASGEGRPLEITIRVHWAPGHTGGHTHLSLREAFHKSFESKGITAVDVRFLTGRDRTTVTYVIGSSTIGPVPVEQAAQGVNAAVDAFHMSEEERERFVNGE